MPHNAYAVENPDRAIIAAETTLDLVFHDPRVQAPLMKWINDTRPPNQEGDAEWPARPRGPHAGLDTAIHRGVSGR